MPPTPRSSQKKLPTKKTLESKIPPKRENPTAIESPNPPNSNLPAAARLELDQNIGKTVQPRIVTIPSSLRSSKVKPKSSEEKEETLLRIGRKYDKGEGKSYKQEEEVVAEEEDGVLERANNRRKQRDYEVFVGGLDRDAVEEDVEEAFKGVGDVVEVRLVKKAYSQRNKGFAFVRFATVEQAKRAVTEIRSVKKWCCKRNFFCGYGVIQTCHKGGLGLPKECEGDKSHKGDFGRIVKKKDLLGNTAEFFSSSASITHLK